MRILFMSETFYPHAGGAELATYLYAKLLAKAGHKIIIVTNLFENEPIKSETEGFIIYRMPLLKEGQSVKYSIFKRFDILFTKVIKKLLNWSDVVYIPRFWFTAIRMAKHYKKPIITHLHDYIPICPLAVFYNENTDSICEHKFSCSGKCIYAFERRKRGVASSFLSSMINFASKPIIQNLIGQSDKIICVSEAQKNIILKYSNFPDDKLEVVYNPLPPIRIKPMEGDDFGYFGGLNPRKGLDLLHRALSYGKYLGGKSVNVHATRFTNVNEKILSKYRSSGFITYDKLHSSDFDNLYKKIKAVIVPSIWQEPMGYVVAEAILQKRVLIASSMGGIPELVHNCKGVFLFNPHINGFRDLYSKIKYVDELDKEVVNDLGVQNREIFLNRFSDEKSLHNFTNVLNYVVK